MLSQSSRIALVLAGLAIALMPIAAHATNVSVYCAGSTPPNPLPADTYTTMTDALNALAPSPNGPHVINVRGSCHNENLQIIGFSRLTIQSLPGMSATISQDQPAACGAPSATTFESQAVLRILDSHQVLLRVTGNPPASHGTLILQGGVGVFMDDSSVTLSGVTVANGRSTGITLNNASNLNLEGRAPSGAHIPNTVQNHCGGGLSVSNGSRVVLNNGNIVQNNQGSGLSVGGVANLNATSGPDGQILIQGNQGPGIDIPSPGSQVGMSGQVIVQNNATTSGPIFFRAGIVVTSGLLVLRGNGVQVINNSGPGIWADMQGKVRLGGPLATPPIAITISGNTEEGLRLLHMSVAWMLGGTITGNIGADAICDHTSLLFGDVTGIALNKCANTQQDKKK